jgi:hypothetical protein
LAALYLASGDGRLLRLPQTGGDSEACTAWQTAGDARFGGPARNLGCSRGSWGEGDPAGGFHLAPRQAQCHGESDDACEDRQRHRQPRPEQAEPRGGRALLNGPAEPRDERLGHLVRGHSADRADDCPEVGNLLLAALAGGDVLLDPRKLAPDQGPVGILGQSLSYAVALERQRTHSRIRS